MTTPYRVGLRYLEAYPAGTLIASPLAGQHAYELMEAIGEGGFGKVWRARGLDAETQALGPLCIKVLRDQRSWHGEAFYGELLRDESRVIRLHESFPYTVSGGGDVTQYFVLVSELAPQGDLEGYLRRRGRWLEERAVREVAALLEVLERLHSVGVLHRDLTPKNILVDARGRLKLADFGIARLSLGADGVAAGTRNPMFVTRGHREGKHKRWTAPDDVHQVGQILAMLLAGRGSMLSAAEIGKLTCSDRTRRVLQTATGPRGKRYSEIALMRQALEGQEWRPVRTIKGKKVVVTGVLSISRAEAILRIQQAGGSYQRAVTSNTDVIVVGRVSPSYKGQRRKGKKLREAESLGRRVRKIPNIGEMEFMKLVK